MLERNQCDSIESTVLKYRLCVSDHIAHMNNNSISKQLLYEELANGKLSAHKPKMYYKGSLKESLNVTNISTYDWEFHANEHST